MPRAAAPSLTQLARVRQHFGLSQTALAALLGLSGAQLSRLEAGQQGFSRELAERLAPFLAHVPPLGEAAARLLADAQAQAAPPPPPPGFFDPGPLERRRAACLHEARNLRWQARGLPRRAAVAAHWAQAMPALRAALPPPPPAGEAPATHEAVRLRYVHAWLALVPQALPPGVLAEYHLRHQRALALEAEAAALGEILASQLPPPSPA